MLTDSLPRCAWVPLNDPLYRQYHDTEWGVPIHDDRIFFEFLVLEGFQAGLSWNTIIRKRENFRKSFDDFDPAKVARYNEGKILELLSNPGIIRNRLKVLATIGNARAFLNIQRELGSFDAYIWAFVGGRPKHNAWRAISEIPNHTPESDALSKDLLLRGFKFVGSTIVYAHMQATGMVNDHTIDCFCYQKIQNME
jgi:DNA-3-methyladenine glycosylase I